MLRLPLFHIFFFGLIGLYLLSTSSCSSPKVRWQDINSDSASKSLKLHNILTVSADGISWVYAYDSLNIWHLSKRDTYADSTQVYYSNNGGKSWRLINEIVQELVSFPIIKHRSTLFFTTPDSLYISTDTGHHFRSIQACSGDATNYYDAKNQNLYITNFNQKNLLYQYSIKNNISIPIKINFTPEVITAFNDTLCVISDSSAIYKSVNSGYSWKIDSLSLPKSESLRSGFAMEKYIYLEYERSTGYGKPMEKLFRYSSDFGHSWRDTSVTSLKYIIHDSLVFEPLAFYDNADHYQYINFRKIYDNEINHYQFPQDFFLDSRDENLFFTTRQYSDTTTHRFEGVSWKNPSSYQFHYADVVPSAYLSRISSYKLIETNDAIGVIAKLTKGVSFEKSIALRLGGAQLRDYDKLNKLLSDKPSYLNSDSTEVKISFNKDSIGALAGITDYKLALYYDNGGGVIIYALGPFRYSPTSFFQRYPAVSIVLSIVIGFFFVLTCLLIFSPLALYTIYSKFKILGYLESVSGKFGIVFKLLSEITLFPVFVRHKRVLDAWVRKHYSAITSGFKSEHTVQQLASYVPLPIAVDGIVSNFMEKPSPESFSVLFHSKRTVLEIVGAGGIGKSTLALKIASWVSDPTNLASFNHIYLPILIEEEISDLTAIVQRKLRAWIDEEIEHNFLEALLAKKRILIIIDALSERSELTQRYISTIHGKLPVNALLITSRSIFNLETTYCKHLYPQYLGADKLLFFITSILVEQNIPIFKPVECQLELGKKLSTLFSFSSKEIPVSPIILRLAIDKAISLAKESPNDSIAWILSKLPNSIPEAFFEYLISVNPIGNVPNKVSNEEIQVGAELVAYLSLGDNFIPQDVSKRIVSAKLKEEDLINEKRDTLKRLIANGILIERTYANDVFIRFTLDPLSEYLAGMYWAKQCGREKQKWEELYSRVKVKSESASNFLQALELIHYTYAATFSWWKPQE